MKLTLRLLREWVRSDEYAKKRPEIELRTKYREVTDKEEFKKLAREYENLMEQRAKNRIKPIF